MNKAEQIFRSLFKDEAAYEAFRLAHKVIVDNHEMTSEEDDHTEIFFVPFIRVVSKDSDVVHVVADDKPSYVQYSSKRDVVILNWIEGYSKFTRADGKPVSVDINYDIDVKFTYDDSFNPDSVMWNHLFEDGQLDWACLNRLKAPVLVVQ